MTKLKKEFSNKDWMKCCGSFCADCEISQLYRKEFGKKEGEQKFKKDRKKIRKKLKGEWKE